MNIIKNNFLNTHIFICIDYLNKENSKKRKILKMNEEAVKNSFLKVKEDINKLESFLSRLEEAINEQKKEIENLRSQIISNSLKNETFKPYKDILEKSSTGNEGVYANMHAHMQANMQANKQVLNTSSFKDQLEEIFNRLTKKEFLIFLTIYQLEEEKILPTYTAISHYLKLSQGCIRTHITNLLRKEVPLIKTKINNKLTLLGIKPDFKDLDLKQKLTSLYYNLDTAQKRLTNI